MEEMMNCHVLTTSRPVDKGRGKKEKKAKPINANLKAKTRDEDQLL